MYPQRFLSRFDFDLLAAVSRSELPIVKWRSLEVGAVYRVLKLVELPKRSPPTDPSKQETPQQVYLMTAETEGRGTINVYITSIIYKELKKYDLTQGNVFIKPLGTKMSDSSR